MYLSCLHSVSTDVKKNKKLFHIDSFETLNPHGEMPSQSKALMAFNIHFEAAPQTTIQSLWSAFVLMHQSKLLFRSQQNEKYRNLWMMIEREILRVNCQRCQQHLRSYGAKSATFEMLYGGVSVRKIHLADVCLCMHEWMWSFSICSSFRI